MQQIFYACIVGDPYSLSAVKEYCYRLQSLDTKTEYSIIDCITLGHIMYKKVLQAVRKMKMFRVIKDQHFQ